MSTQNRAARFRAILLANSRRKLFRSGTVALHSYSEAYYSSGPDDNSGAAPYYISIATVSCRSQVFAHRFANQNRFESNSRC
jgi:hypothetical protein